MMQSVSSIARGHPEEIPEIVLPVTPDGNDPADYDQATIDALNAEIDQKHQELQDAKSSKTASGFTEKELAAMHRYCLKYRDLVRSGGVPSDDQTRQFRLYSNITYMEGTAYGRP